VIVLNGGSSSGKSGIARCLQAVLPDPWLAFGTDTLVQQQRWKNALGVLSVLWVAVRCDAAVAAAREVARGDRVAGMAASQAEVVHQGVAYDLQVDTTHAETLACAQAIAARLP
jgi:chloramphenicol 3-O phosphotransferase